MATSNLIKNRAKFSKISKLKLDIGYTRDEKRNLYLKYLQQSVSMRNLAGSGNDFPSRVHKILPEELQKYQELYFKQEPINDIQLQVEMENTFTNSRIKKMEEDLDKRKELEKIKEVEEFSKLGFNADVNPFSEEGKAYMRSEASSHKNGMRGFIADRLKSTEEKKQEQFKQQLQTISNNAVNRLRNMDKIELGYNEFDLQKRYGGLAESIKKEVLKASESNPYISKQQVKDLTRKLAKNILLEAVNKKGGRQRTQGLDSNERFIEGAIVKDKKKGKGKKGKGKKGNFNVDNFSMSGGDNTNKGRTKQRTRQRDSKSSAGIFA